MTGILSDKTVRTALKGLEEKFSIRVIRNISGDSAGPYFQVHTPKEILAMRKRSGIVIDGKTKRVITMPVTAPVTTVETESITTPITTVDFNQSPPVNSTGHDKYNINTPSLTPASSAPTGDDEKLSKVRKLFEQLSNGGQWRDGRDNETYQQIRNTSIYHIILGLAYSVSRSPEHKMSSLAYAVPSILKHAEDMSEFPEQYLAEIAYRTKRRVINCIEQEKWDIADWDR